MDDVRLLRDDELNAIVRQCADFLNPMDARARSYRAEINLMLAKGAKRVTVSIDDVRSHSRELADG
jgi:DNA replication licensing factor MCM3